MKGLSYLTGQCKIDGNLFCFFLPPTKKERNPTLIAHIGTPSRANVTTEALPKNAILPTQTLYNSNRNLYFFDFENDI